MFSIDETVTTSRVDEQGKLKLFAATQMIQDCSELWINSEPLLRECFIREHRAQLLASRQVEIIRVPDWGEKLTVTTSVFDCQPLFGFRNTIVRDAQGEPCYVTWSMGAFVDSTTGALKKLPDEMIQTITYDEKYPMDYKDRRIHVPKDGIVKACSPYIVKRNDIDYNHHMNNAHYVRLAMEVLPKDFEVKSCRIEYKMPLRMGEQANITLTQVAEDYYVTITSERGLCTQMEFKP